MNLNKFCGRQLRRRIRRLNRMGLLQGLKDISICANFNPRWAHNRCYREAFNAPQIIRNRQLEKLIDSGRLVYLDVWRRKRTAKKVA